MDEETVGLMTVLTDVMERGKRLMWINPNFHFD